MSIVTLKDTTFTPRPPESMAAAYDVAAAVKKNAARAMYASLGLCWAGPKRLRSKLSDSYDVLQYGGEVFDELIAAGFAAGEVAEAAGVTFLLLVEGLPSAREVDRTEGNSATPEGLILT